VIDKKIRTERIKFGGGGSQDRHGGGYQGSPSGPSGPKGPSGPNGPNGGGGGGQDSPYRQYTAPAPAPKTAPVTFKGPNEPDDPNAPPAYEIIGGEKFDVTPDTRDDRERAKVKQSILDAPIPNITDKGTSFFKDGNLLNSFAPKKNQFNMFSLLGNAALFAANPVLYAKYNKAKSIYKGAKFAKDLIQPYTTKNLNKPFKIVEGLTENIGLKDKNVIKSFKDSFTNNLTSKTKTKTKPVINTNTDNDNNGIASLEDANVLQDEYSILFQKLQTGNISDAERTRYTMLKNMLGI
jgi:hypothetical protein